MEEDGPTFNRFRLNGRSGFNQTVSVLQVYLETTEKEVFYSKVLTHRASRAIGTDIPYLHYSTNSSSQAHAHLNAQFSPKDFFSATPYI